MVRTATSRTRQSEAQARESGFTLFELMIVMAIIAILASVAVPSYINAVRHGREAALRQDLWVMRQAIDSYTVDKEKAPQSLDDLVQSGYLKAIPTDPMTGRDDTWMPDTSDTLMDIDETAGGINNVHSGAQGVATDGSTYNTW
ncbi:MAG TPA: type II secretion system protein [Acidobacteriaceae bacterium]|nr:type II secretion system protein [Acidobacteriaceae bacterium]